jgi:hypothetical protein
LLHMKKSLKWLMINVGFYRMLYRVLILKIIHL